MNEFRKRDTGELYTDAQVRNFVPEMGLPGVLDAATLDKLGPGFDPVMIAPQPKVAETQIAIRAGVVQDGNGNWVYNWDVQDLPEATVQANQLRTVAEFKRAMTKQVQNRLDMFAATRGYGDERTSPTTSIATYIGSVVPKFAMEAGYFRDQRDLTWAKLYEIEQEVATGVRPPPTSFTEIEVELPKLRWPDEPEVVEEDTTPPVNPIDPDKLPVE